MKNESIDLDQGAQAGSNGPPFKLIALLIVVVLLAIFVFQNGQKASIDFLWIDGRWPVWIVIAISVVTGIVLDRLFTWQWRRARRRKQTIDG
jgi:uncharacterized integral membrane protein